MMTTSRSLILALLFSLALRSANAQAPSRNYLHIRYLGGDPAIRNFVMTADSKVADQFHVQGNYIVCLTDSKTYEEVEKFWTAESKKKNPPPAKDATAFEVSERAPEGTVTSFNFLVTGSKSSKDSFASIARFADVMQQWKTVCPSWPYLLRIAIGKEAPPKENPENEKEKEKD